MVLHIALHWQCMLLQQITYAGDGYITVRAYGIDAATSL